MKKTQILTLLLMLTVSVAFGQTPYKLNYPDITIGNSPTGKIVLNGSNLRLPRIADGSLTDSVLTIVSGVIKKVPRSQFSGGGGGSVSWGAITGTLSDQADLQAALNAKLNSSTAASTYYPITNPAGYITAEGVPNYTAGNGLNLTGTQFKVDTAIIATKAFANTKAPKLQNVVYADDYTDTWTGKDPITGHNEGSAVIKAIKKASLSGGGTVVLSEKTYIPTGADFFSPLTYPNIYIKGAKMPYFNNNGTALANGSIIQGSFVWIVNGEALKISDVGIDAGKNVCDVYFGGVPQEGMVWCKPIDHNPASPYSKNAYAKNITSLNYNPSALTHAFLFEGIDGGYADNILTMYGYHGIVIKSKKIYFGSGKAYGHSGENFIIKSDDYAISQDVSIQSLILDSYEAPTGVNPYVSFPEPVYGLLFDAQTSTVNTININNIVIKRGSKGINFKTSNGNNIGDININSVEVYGAVNSLEYSGSGLINRTNIAYLNAVNSTGDIINTSNTAGTYNNIGLVHTASNFVLVGKPLSLVRSSNNSSLYINSIYARDLDLVYDISTGSNIEISEEKILDYVNKANNILPFYNKNKLLFDSHIQPNVSGFATQYFDQLDGGQWLFTSRPASENNVFNLYSQTGGAFNKHLEFSRDGKSKFFGDIISNLSGAGDRPVFASADGTLKIGTSSAYTLPIASSTVLGGIKVGSGLAIDGTGILSATSGGSQTLQQVLTAGATATVEPIIQRNGSNLTLGLSGGGGANGFTIRGTGRDWYHFVQTNGNYTFGANQGDKYFFTNDGKLGINQSTPTQAIDVIGQVKSTASGSGNAFAATSTTGVGVLSQSTSGISISSIATTGKAGRFETSSGTGITLDVVNNGTGDIINGSNSGGLKYRVTNAGGSVASDDVEITSATKGVILRAPDGGRWRLTISNTGVISTTLVP